MRTTPVAVFAACLVLTVQPARAQTAERRLSLDVAATYEVLSDGFAPWRSVSLDAGGAVTERQTLYGAVRETSRFALRDHEFMAGLRQRLSVPLTVVTEVEVSPTHQVLPRWAAAAQAEVALAHGWGLQAGLRHREYASATVDLGSVTVERYWGRYRAAYTVYVSALHGGGASTSHRVQGDYYYGRLGSSIGVSAAAGTELEHLGPRGVLSTDVRSLAVVGRQWLTPRWFVRYDGLVHEQGMLYTRTRLGVSFGHRF